MSQQPAQNEQDPEMCNSVKLTSDIGEGAIIERDKETQCEEAAGNLNEELQVKNAVQPKQLPGGQRLTPHRLIIEKHLSIIDDFLIKAKDNLSLLIQKQKERDDEITRKEKLLEKLVELQEDIATLCDNDELYLQERLRKERELNEKEQMLLLKEAELKRREENCVDFRARFLEKPDKKL